MSAPPPARASAPRGGRLRSGLRFQPFLRGGRARGGWVAGGRGPCWRMEGPAVDATLPCRQCKIKPVALGEAPFGWRAAPGAKPGWREAAAGLLGAVDTAL